MFKKNALFFWLDRMHIQSSERYFLSGMMVVYGALWAVQPIFEIENPYDDDYYAPLMEAFYERSAVRHAEQLALLDRYYPGEEEKIEAMARSEIPERLWPGVEARLMGEVESVSAGDVARGEVRDRALDTVESDGISGSSVREGGRMEGDRMLGSSVREGGRMEGDRGEVVNINTGGVGELEKLPGIGKALAERIIAYREENGPFKSIEDIVKVRGIGQVRFESFKHLLEI
jgi:competence ComEA-like helix-hairpin-helix protein